MNHLDIQHSRYSSPPTRISLPSKVMPSAVFYMKFIGIVLRAGLRAKNGKYDDDVWILDSLRIVQLLEQAGLSFEVTGLESLEKLDKPCVFIGNHMSIMETLILPVVILPYTRVTFVIKESLLEYPVFKYVMRSREPIAVTRTNPRQDLKTVMTEGPERLARGMSIVVFPQTTRSTGFDPKQFGSIGTKLAKKAEAPIIPLALKTDAWQNGKMLKDFGKLNARTPVKIAFGKPLHVSGKGTEEHQQVVDFIGGKLQEWQQ